jgi:hypothetical protein
LHGLIPFLGILVNRHIVTASGCPVYLVGCEDIMHTLFTRLQGKQIWGKHESAVLSLAGRHAKEDILTARRKQEGEAGALLSENGNVPVFLDLPTAQ